MFKRGKNKKQDGADTATTDAPPQQQQAPGAPAQSQSQSPPPQIDAKAPQLPPIGNASPLQGATESSKSIPPTHPLFTGEQSRPQEAVPQNKDADTAPGPPLGAPSAVGGVGSANDGLKEPDKLGAENRDVSPPVSTVDAADAPKSSAVSAISSEQPKTDGPAEGASTEAAKVEETKGESARHIEPVEKLMSEATEPSTQAPTTAVDTDTNAATTESSNSASPAVKENVPPQINGASPVNPTASSTTDNPATAPTAGSSATDSKPAPSDEKAPTTGEEPPPIKTVRAAPGMSATSGPLEDFPEGGDVKD